MALVFMQKHYWIGEKGNVIIISALFHFSFNKC